MDFITLEIINLAMKQLGDDLPDFTYCGIINHDQNIKIPLCKDKQKVITHIGGGWENAVYKLTLKNLQAKMRSGHILLIFSIKT